MNKPKTPQKENLEGVDGRDLFQTPNYATDMLVPFLETDTPYRIWEPAAGLGKIVKRLKYYGFEVYGTDLQDEMPVNFLTDPAPIRFDCIVTNTPFSLKRKFYLKCREYGVPFALLIPADYSSWIIQAIQDGAEKIIPTRRIDYITPNILWRIHEGEVWEHYVYKFSTTLEKFKKEHTLRWNQMMNAEPDYELYDSIYDVPSILLRKYSSSYFHSMWLTWGFGLGKSETFVELTNEMKNNI